ncbi:hypothetical protein N9381_01020 [Paracoccaceae bacterium]|jgi:hypothetical protein|nr:hypothetical protein [Paracoccaceae bacterium]MBT6543177.1 hypothetical protein [Paracoccaceae bacterium]MDB3910384.1 hypothetical protein [Paracoccaceae bacterium]HBS40220.1 hypothetical protein [Paracoccaceae bacterium]
MKDDWVQTQAIRVSAQSAELQLTGQYGSPELVVSGGLMNIARGSCTLRIKTTAVQGTQGIGQLKIEAMRPVMHAEVTLSAAQFDCVVKTLQGSLPRPATAILALNQTLSVSVAGDLSIDSDLSCNVMDISWVMPLQ